MIEVKPFFVVGLVLFRCAFPPRLEDNLGSFCRNALLREGFPDNLHGISFSLPSMDHLCPEMQAMTKMADLTKFRQTDFGQIDDFHANYIT